MSNIKIGSIEYQLVRKERRELADGTSIEIWTGTHTVVFGVPTDQLNLSQIGTVKKGHGWGGRHRGHRACVKLTGNNAEKIAGIYRGITERTGNDLLRWQLEQNREDEF